MSFQRTNKGSVSWLKQQFKKADKGSSEAVGIARRLSGIFRDKGNLNASLKWKERAYNIDPNTGTAVALAVSYRDDLNDNEKAVKWFNEVFKNEPNPITAVSLALSYRDEGDYEMALYWFETAYDLEPNVKTAWTLSNLNYGHFQNDEEGTKWAEKARDMQTSEILDRADWLGVVSHLNAQTELEIGNQKLVAGG